MISNARGSHVSPGIYYTENDVTYSTKSLGITTLGLAGETLKGPAFEPVSISKWSEFVDYFGDVSAEKFKDTNYPKYELPYIAKSYLKESQRLTVVRALGLSGYNAGPAWVVKAKGKGKEYAIAILRSRGEYVKYKKIEGDPTDPCDDSYKYDYLDYFAKEVSLAPYANAAITINCNTAEGSTEEEGYEIDRNNYGRFTIVVKDANDNEYRYPVSLNYGDKDYITDRLGTKASDGESLVFVEALYDVALEQMIFDGKITEIANELEEYKPFYVTAASDPVLDFVTIEPDQLKRSNVGQLYFYLGGESAETFTTCGHFVDEHTALVLEDGVMEAGNVYRVVSYRKSDGVHYGYACLDYVKKELDKSIDESDESGVAVIPGVFVKSEERYYVKPDSGASEYLPVMLDLNNYKDQYSCASTPWIVSELKGDGKNIEVKKLFRFHTISDGDMANRQVKISIQNIRPNDGTFDVIIRDINDTDGNIVILERFTKCSMVPGTSNYIGLKIGTSDGAYMVNSKYVTVEVVENDMTKACVPAGFLGYPLGSLRGFSPADSEQHDIEIPAIQYNVDLDDEIKLKRQYFGLSNLSGVDYDIFSYKGNEAYKTIENYSHGFHLDSTINETIWSSGETSGDTFEAPICTVDGKEGWIFDTVSPNCVTSDNLAPIFGFEDDMVGTIYEDVNARKFTVYPYGGFDGWDVYRNQRTNTDEYRKNLYKGSIKHGVGQNFSDIKDATGLALNGIAAISTDYYAYLAAYRQFANPESVDINVFATPGIDYVNQTLLSEDALDMVEDLETGRGGDAIYVMTTPDHPAGASDSIDDMFSPDEVVENLVDSDIDSSYACTYYPWVKYFDSTNKIYINLPATKDVVRNFALTDNKSYPWFAPAGINRGDVECARAHFITKLNDEDVVYEGLINPVKTFAEDGVKLWGNKTMYSADTPLNRVNVRRLMIRVKKLITRACRQLIFEPNDATVKNQFLGLVQPILNDVRANRGMVDYKIEVDDSVEARDRHELPAAIWVKPAATLEYIPITFTITPEGTKWD